MIAENVNAASELSPKEKVAQGVAAYLLNAQQVVSITGAKEKVELFVEALKDLKALVDELVPIEEAAALEEAQLEEAKAPPSSAKTLVAGIVGYLLGKATGVKIQGSKQDADKLIAAIDRLRVAMGSSSEKPRW